jgi:regulator of nonsense transcripts 3
MKFSCLIEKKITTTPLLDFLRQRRAEKQRIRDERREERKRKEQERKRLKDADRDRRRGSGKSDTASSRDMTSDSVLRVKWVFHIILNFTKLW